MVDRILVVGGNGLIGAAAALHLAELGHAVTIAGRTPPRGGALEGLPFLRGSFLTDELDAALPRFDALVFAAGNDVRQLPPGEDETAYFHRANSIGVPSFFARAKAAGIGRAVYVGSWYSYILSPAEIAASGYVTSRLRADEGVRALAEPGFQVCSLNAPYTIGHVEGVPGLPIEYLVRYLLGQFGEGPRAAIPGGANFMSTRSFAEAVAGALARGESGKGYLMGDENWTFEAYANAVWAAMGSRDKVRVLDEPHPAMPDQSLYAGRSRVVAIEPDPAMVARFGYRRHDVARVIEEMTPYYLRLAQTTRPA